MLWPIEYYLKLLYDELRRDDRGTIQYDGNLTEAGTNLLAHPDVSSDGFDSYYDYTNALLQRMILPNSTLYSIPSNPINSLPYVNNVLIQDIWQNWSPGSEIFISAGTGRGKNTFIKKELLKKISHDHSYKAIVFENRESLMRQQTHELVSEISPSKYDAQKIKLSEGKELYFGESDNILLISYQTASIKIALHDKTFLDFVAQAKYLIFDEIHYILDDANFNNGISFFVNYFFPNEAQRQSRINEINNEMQYTIPYHSEEYRKRYAQLYQELIMLQSKLQNNPLQDKIKIYMSGSMEEFYSYIQMRKPFKEKPDNILDIKKYLDEQRENIILKDSFIKICVTSRRWQVLSMPTNYSYITPFKYGDLNDICSQIQKTPTNEKWLIFVRTINEGLKLKLMLESIGDSSVCFLTADNKKAKENVQYYQELVESSMFSCRILIATTVIYNGINIKDKRVKHIVLPFTTPPIIRQLIGRKRIEKDETVNVYFPKVTYKDVRKEYFKALSEHYKVMGLRNNLISDALIQSNNLTFESGSRYYSLEMLQTNSGMALQPILNDSAIAKLNFDTCFYIYALHRMNESLEDKAVDYIYLLLNDLGIANKYTSVTDLIIPSQQEKKECVKKELIEYFEGIVDTTISTGKKNARTESFKLLNSTINVAYKSIYGHDIHSQWKGRGIPVDDVNAFLNELQIPYYLERGRGWRKIIKQNNASQQ